MLTTAAAYGLFTCLWFPLLVSGESPDAPILIHTREFEVDYVINQAAQPIQSVALWVTQDRGRSWQLLGYDQDRQSPYRVQAPEEGLLGVFLVVSNRVGPSSASPTSSTMPHRWLFVDATPPIVQLHSLRQTTSMGQRVVQIQWSAMDAHFVPRPISIDYQLPGQPHWIPINGSPFTNTGRFDWRIPAQLSGPVGIRLTVRDAGGHEIQSSQQLVELYPMPINAPLAQPASWGGSINAQITPTTPATPSARITPTNPTFMTTQTFPTTPTSSMNSINPAAPNRLTALSGVMRGSVRSRNHAERLFDLAMEHRDRGEYREGIARMREVIRLNPGAVHAIVEMADMLYRIGDLIRARSAYELALQQEPTLRSALRGVAKVHHQNGDYSTSSQYLRTILRYNPHDAEIWMNLGDVAVYQGDEVLARECYTRATQIDSNASQVVTEARQRLALMDEASRQIRPWEP